MIPGPYYVLECPLCSALARNPSIFSGNTFAARMWTDGFVENPMMPEAIELGRCPVCEHLFWVGDAREVGIVPLFDERRELSKLVITNIGPRRVDAMQALREVTGCSLQVVRELIDNPPFDIGEDVPEKQERVREELRSAGMTVERVVTQVIPGPPAPPEQWSEAPFLSQPTCEDLSAALGVPSCQTKERQGWLRLRLWWAHNTPRRADPEAPLTDQLRAAMETLQPLLSNDDPEQRLMLAETHRELGNFDEALRLLDWGFPDGFAPAVEHIADLAEAKDTALKVVAVTA